MKLTLNIAAVVLSLSGIASAASIQASAFVDLDFTTDSADLANQLDSSFTAKVGVYSGAALTVTSTFTDINAGWTGAGEVAFASGAAVGYNGYFDTGGLGFTDALGIAGSNVFVWVTDGANLNYVMVAISGDDNTFKNDADIPNSGIVSIRQTTAGNWQTLLGTFDAGGANAGYGGSYVLNEAVGVPEPTVALLGAFGVVGLLRRRRA